MRTFGPYRPSFFCRIAVILFAGLLFFAQPAVSQQRKESRLERINKQKNKNNRNKKRRGDVGVNNNRQKRAVRAKTRSSQGDRPYKGDITGRPVRTKSSPARPTMSNYARPNPYAGKRRTSEAGKAKIAARYGRRIKGVNSISQSSPRRSETRVARKAFPKRFLATSPFLVPVVGLLLNLAATRDMSFSVRLLGLPR